MGKPVDGARLQRAEGGTVKATTADSLGPLLTALLGDPLPLQIRFWDGSSVGPSDSKATVDVRSPRALRRILYAPGELGAARAYVAGELDVDGDIWSALATRDHLSAPGQPLRVTLGPRTRLSLIGAAARTGVLGPPLAPPKEEARLRGGRHSKARDAEAIAHHYDISNDFYRLVLGETMTYSCAYFPSPDTSLDEAQRAKYDLICRKLSLGPGMRLLDIGCGWGGMVMHAAQHYGVEAVGVTISQRQASLAAERVAGAGLSSRVEIRRQDYRDVDDGPYDAISSIGMFEHVGVSMLSRYFGAVHGLLRAGGRLLNHGISRPGNRSSSIGPKSFITRYVFPDGELHEVGAVVSAIQGAGLEVRDLESLREHYARTLRSWVANLEANWESAVRLVGANRARIWRLYMAGSAVNFAANRTNIHQILAVRTADDGYSGMPATREELLGRSSAG